MDIISHTLTGTAVGTVLATFSNATWKKKALIILAGSFGGALPDFDAISLWSKFDSTIGALLNLTHSGKQIYFGKLWYSHHAAFHSILTPLFFIFISILTSTIKKRHFNLSKIKASVVTKKHSYLAFFFGFLFHLLEDMPTPASVWGGVNLFFPSSNYIGGFGNIWWWNNYDLVLIIVSVIVLNLLINSVPKYYYTIKKKLSISVFILAMSAFMFQIKTRPIDFSYTGHSTNYNTYEAQSKQIQKDILGDKLYNFMMSIDNKMPLNF